MCIRDRLYSTVGIVFTAAIDNTWLTTKRRKSSPDGYGISTGNMTLIPSSALVTAAHCTKKQNVGQSRKGSAFWHLKKDIYVRSLLPVSYTHLDTMIIEAEEKMQKHRVSTLLVTNKANKVTGLVRIFD